jgi:hypothetical protein
MNLIPAAIARGVARSGLLTQKNSPAILFGVGVVGMVGSTVLACRATLKVDEVLEETRENLEKIKTYDNPEKYSEMDRKKDVTTAYTKVVFNVAKLYGPAILLGGASIFCLTKSHTILSARNAALTAAYAAVDEAFKKYRGRVVDKYGVEEDQRFRHDSEPVEILNEKGNITHSTRVSGDPTMYARFFDQLSTEWSRDPEYNLVYLKHQQSYFNHMLRARGHVFLNEVYDALGIERSKEGNVVGWVFGGGDDSDNHVDFGLYEDNPKARDFINGREGSILLDFNVDGTILDKIGGKSEQVKWQT